LELLSKRAKKIMATILLIDDDRDLCDLVEMTLEIEHKVVIAGDGASGLKSLRGGEFDVVILDWELPDMSGTDVAQVCRDENLLTPILMLTGRNTIDDKVKGLDAGADDYLTKPFEMRELEARVRTILRRAKPTKRSDVIDIGGLSLQRSTHRVTFKDSSIELAAHEFAVLELLMSNPERIYSLQLLSDKLWNGEGSDNAIRACLKRLRQKLGAEAGEYIVTKIDAGYCFKKP
jgi:DNA-binding response OmpR family regulator